MTFCLGMKVEDGLIGIADSRVTTGVECITARKVSIHQHGRHSRRQSATIGFTHWLPPPPEIRAGAPLGEVDNTQPIGATMQPWTGMTFATCWRCSGPAP